MRTNSCCADGTGSCRGQMNHGLLRRYNLMLLSPIIRKPLLWWALVLALPTQAWSQSAYTTNQAEYSISGALRGDQVRPQAAITPLGGFLVWDDNAIDGHGQGIGALALDSNFNPSGAPFRVNQIEGNDQSHAQIALLRGGGAVIVWQGGVAGRENIYARFLSSSNTWLTGDILLNTARGEFHKYPAVAALANSNAVVVWGSYNQQTSGSMQDIYAQVVSPIGQKVGAEFLVNQFTPYNQRNPGVAPLKNGGFIVVWVSEQERVVADSSASNVVFQAVGPSADIYARTFGANGALTGANTNEFRVNAGSNPCATPAVTVGPDGTALVTWAERDMVVHTNAWDILARSISSAGLLGTARKVNTYTVGDQYAPQIAANGSSAFVAWTSLGQDGSWEGVYGQMLQFDGTAVGSEVRLNSTTVGRQIQPSIAGDGTARFLGLWACYATSSSTVDLFAQRYASAAYSPIATVNNVFAAPANDPFPPILPAGEISLVKLMGGTTNLPVSNVLAMGVPLSTSPTNATAALASVAGTYNGLIWDPNQVMVQSAGSVTLTTVATPTTKGELAYSGKIYLAGSSYSFSGKFLAATGLATNYTLTSPSTFLKLQLQASLFGGDQIVGTLTGLGSNGKTNFVSLVTMDRAGTGTGTAQTFTMVVPPVVNGPVGFGYGTIAIDRSGNLQWAGVLADGTPVSQTTTVCKQGLWPLFASLYGGGGVAISWMQFATNKNDMSGQFIWIKNGGLGSAYTSMYAAGITNSAIVEGAPYVAPTSTSPPLNPTNRVTFLGGGLTNASASFTNWFTVNTRGQIASTNKQFTLSVTSSSGLISGSTLNPQTGKSLSFLGVIYQRTNAAGQFPGTKVNGQIFIAPAK